MHEPWGGVLSGSTLPIVFLWLHAALVESLRVVQDTERSTWPVAILAQGKTSCIAFVQFALHGSGAGPV